MWLCLCRRDSHLILLCTQNCLQSPHIARWMLQARMVPTCQLLPVLGDESFQVGKINEHLSPLSDLPDVDHNAYSQVIKATFLELAVPFICSQSSEDDLGIRSRQVVARLYGQLKRLNTKLLMVGTDVTSIEVHVPDLEHDQTSMESSNASIRMLNAAHRTNSIEDIMKSETISRAFWAFPKLSKETCFLLNGLHGPHYVFFLWLDMHRISLRQRELHGSILMEGSFLWRSHPGFWLLIFQSLAMSHQPTRRLVGDTCLEGQNIFVL